MTVTVCMDETGAIWIVNGKGTSSPNVSKTEDETEDAGHHRLLTVYPTAHGATQRRSIPPSWASLSGGRRRQAQNAAGLPLDASPCLQRRLDGALCALALGPVVKPFSSSRSQMARPSAQIGPVVLRR
jgi:hypothetical protein